MRATGELQASGAGIHVNFTRTTNTTTVNFGNDDYDLASAVGEATLGFSLAEFERLKALATGTDSGTGPQTLQLAQQTKTLTD